MVDIRARAGFANFFDTGRLTDFTALNDVNNASYLEAFGVFSESGNWSVTTLSSSKIVLAAEDPWLSGLSLEAQILGTGIGPVSSLAALDDAIRSGVATGDFTQIKISGSKSALWDGDDTLKNKTFLTFDFADDGYTVTSGNLRIEIPGTLPSSLQDIFAIGQVADQVAGYSSLTPAQQANVIAQMNTLASGGFSVILNGTTVLELAVSATEISLSQMGYSLVLEGSFPTMVGDAFALLTDLSAALDSGADIDISRPTGYSIDVVKITDPDNKVVLTTVGDLGTSDTISLDTIRLDGKTVNNLVMGDNTENYVSTSFGMDTWTPYIPGDYLDGTAGRDHIFGLGGNDTLFGHKGNDVLFGGTGNDYLDGGAGNDVLNPGSNLSGDMTWGSKGNDTIILTDSGMGFQEITYRTFDRGVDISINGKTNTGTVTKGGAGTDTIVDVAVPMKAGWTSVAGGFSVTGSDFDDSFDIVTAPKSWTDVHGFDGSDSFDLTLSANSILRLSFVGGQGAEVNLKTGVIANDSWGNSETVSVQNKGGQIELNGTYHNDTLVGDKFSNRFILGQGDDVANGLGGQDMVRYDRSGVGSVEVNLTTGTATGTWWDGAFTHTLLKIEDVRGSHDGNDTLIGSAVANRLEGRGGRDTLIGRGGNDILLGEDGHDQLLGGAGRDKLFGGAGNDRLDGGNGNDILKGNLGADDFVFSAGNDRVFGFGGKDQVDLGNAVGITGFVDLKNHHMEEKAGDVIITDADGNTMTLLNTGLDTLDKGDFIF
ncbi:calcium-binding protein [Antarcticimicrobium sediminis]|uniref:Calcium-binding protein n=1 Tax=Antarcticimicrobium sediminis TaxID=2546227 RepID=A0A4R5EVR0_9RHOB|nr:calcium-binding protein [Antarcticimicrobium sediminis]TDE38981.1 calcium-binding protein [Antarcticimicrobium sediminis]